MHSSSLCAYEIGSLSHSYLKDGGLSHKNPLSNLTKAAQCVWSKIESDQSSECDVKYGITPPLFQAFSSCLRSYTFILFE